MLRVGCPTFTLDGEGTQPIRKFRGLISNGLPGLMTYKFRIFEWLIIGGFPQPELHPHFCEVTFI